MTHVGRSRSTVTCWLSIEGRWMFSTKTQKERKGLGTSPFGPAGLTTVPIPCVSLVFLERPRRRFRTAASLIARLPRVL